jgi:hypothetical protein
MPVNDSFDPDQPLPRFLAVPAEYPADFDEFDHSPDTAVGRSWASKVRLLIIAAATIGIAILAIGNPEQLLAEMSASLFGQSAPQLAPVVQAAADTPALLVATADAQNLPSAPNDARARGEADVPGPVAGDPTEKTEPASETLLKQFQSWAADQDAQTSTGAVAPVEQAPASIKAPASIMEDAAPVTKRARVRYRHAQKREPVRATVRNARAEVRPHVRRPVIQEQAARPTAQDPRAQDPRAQDPRAVDPRAQDAAASETQAAPFFGIFGQRN